MPGKLNGFGKAGNRAALVVFLRKLSLDLTVSERLRGKLKRKP